MGKGKGKTKGYKMSLPLPEGTIALHGVMVVSYFDEDGQLNFGLSMKGESNLSAVVGLIELAKARIMAEADSW